MTDDRKLDMKLRLMQLSFFSALAGFMNYLTLYLSSIGISGMGIGIFYALGSLGIVVQQWLFGKLLDRTGAFRLTSGLVMLLSAAAVALIPAMEDLLPLAIAVILVVYAFMKRYGNVFDLWIYRLREDRPGLEYGKTRGMGSLGEGLMGLIMGHIIVKGGFGMLFSITAVLLLISFFSVVSVPDPVRKGREDASPVKFRVRGGLAWYFASFLVLKTASAVVSIFAPLLLERIGGGPDTYGRIIMLSAVVEVIVFSFWGKLMERMGDRASYLLSVLASVACCLLLSLAGNVMLFALGRVLLSVSYVTYTLSHLEYIAHNVDAGMRGRAVLTLSALSSGIGYMISSLLGGAVMEHGTPLSMAAMTTAINALAFLLHFGAFRSRDSR